MADSCMETATSIELFVEILDRYVYYFDQQNESVGRPRDQPLVTVGIVMQYGEKTNWWALGNNQIS